MKLQDHPLAALFPLFPDDELASLAKDINENGQEVPIVLYEGKILDGRNRYRACKVARVEPVTKEYRGSKDPLTYVLSHNLHRRHLNESQRAMIAAEIATRPHGDQPERSANLRIAPTQAEAADHLHVSERSVNAAKQVLERADEETIKNVKNGTVSVTAAVKALPAKKSAASPTPKSDSKYDAALERIGKICGKEVKRAIEQYVIKITTKEVIFWAGLKDNEMADIHPLVVSSRWLPSKAHKFRTRHVSGRTRIEELLSHCVAEGGTWEGTVNGFEITVKEKKRR